MMIFKITLGLILYCAVSLIVFKAVKSLLKGQSVPYRVNPIRPNTVGPYTASASEQKILDEINREPIGGKRNG